MDLPFEKDEVLKNVTDLVLSGFFNKQEIFDRLAYYKWGEEERSSLKKIVDSEYNKHQEQSMHWTIPNDFDALAKSFDELTKMRIVSLHHAGFTNSDGISDCLDAISEMKQVHINVIGFCFYHEQNILTAIASKTLPLGYGRNGDNETVENIANTIVQVLNKNGLRTSWSGNPDEKIMVIDFDWKKKPDPEGWGVNRVKRLIPLIQKGTFTNRNTEVTEASYYCDLGDDKSFLNDNKDCTGAIEDYTKAIELDPRFTAAYINRADAKLFLKDYEGAIADYSRAIELDPFNAEAYGHRSEAKIGLVESNAANHENDFDDQINIALLDHHKAVEIDSIQEAGLPLQAKAKFDAGDYKGAIKIYNYIIRSWPDQYHYYNRSLVFKELKKFDRAEEDLRMSEKLATG